jgi:mRNA interferase MazF
MKRGDVAIVDYPYSDATGTKVRPALVVQSDEKNRVLDDTIIALITSQLRRSSDTHVAIDISTAEGKQSGLRLQSAVQCENLYTIDQKFVLKTIGMLSQAAIESVNECLKKALGLPG